MKAIASFVGTIALMIAGLIGLGMSLCGGIFTFSVLSSKGAMDGLALISVPSLIFGLLILWSVSKKLRQ